MEAVSRRKTVTRRRRLPPRFAICIENTGYPASLELHKVYRVLEDKQAALDNYVRVIDESGEDYLYPASSFVFIDVPKAAERSLLRKAS